VLIFAERDWKPAHFMQAQSPLAKLRRNHTPATGAQVNRYKTGILLFNTVFSGHLSFLTGNLRIVLKAFSGFIFRWFDGVKKHTVPI
jgi:hypothetical protein